ncbi:MAG TPA: hypothetical protein PJ987_11875 [Bacteroidia bacterium]|nr:hypothetical protein [Bacteroidia bacterium]HMY42149.1 hypothetical protein [Chitinophagales bacterium]
MNYKIIINEKSLLDFIDFLPNLKNNECFYVVLMSRAKYAPGIVLSSGQTQLKRFTSNKEHLFSKIKQLECPIGSYTYKGQTLPQESLALYINPNPRDLEKAAKNSLIKLAHLITKPYTGYNPYTEILSEIQTAHSRKPYMDFDFDNIEPSNVIGVLQEKDIINLDAVTIVKTKGGFHLLVEVQKIQTKYQKSWYQSIAKIDGVDMKGDGLLPIPGCSQGNFSPYMFPAVSPQLIDVSGSL